MRATPAAALLLFFASLSPAQAPPTLHGVTPNTVEVPERILHPTAIAEADITMPAMTASSSHAVFVTVSYLVSTTGDVQDAVAINGPAAYRKPAAEGVKQWKYQPYTVNGEPRSVQSMVVIGFQNGIGKRIEAPPPPPAGVPWVGMSGDPVPATPQAAPKPTGPVRISSGMANDLIISRPNPAYPPEAIAAGVQGTVILHAIISEDGTIEKLNVISGPPALTTAAMDAVSRWRYRPYMLNNEPVEVETTINVNFRLSAPPHPSDAPPQ